VKCTANTIPRILPRPSLLPCHVGQDDSGTDAVDAGSSLSRRQRRIKGSDNEVRARRTQQGDHKLDVVAGLQSDNVTGSQTTT